MIFWHVDDDDVIAALERLRSLGVTEHERLTVHEEGFVTASVVDRSATSSA